MPLGNKIALAAIGTTVGLGAAAAAGVSAAGLASEVYVQSNRWRRAQESAHMSRVLSTMQQGPFGPAGSRYGMGSNYGNSAHMTLALHYARNGTGIQNPLLGMAGRFAGSL
jgi:hypothetical protein